MTEAEFSAERNPEIAASMIAMKRAGQMARDLAIQTGTSIVVYEDGQVVWKHAAQLKAEATLAAVVR